MALWREHPGTVSIHAPARGATFGDVGRGAIPSGFNPRPRERGDEIRGRIAYQ